MNRSDVKKYNKMCKLYEAGKYVDALLLAEDLYHRLTLFDDKNLVIDVLIVLYEGYWNRGNNVKKSFPVLARLEYAKALECMDLKLKVKGNNKWGSDLTDTIERIVADWMEDEYYEMGEGSRGSNDIDG